VSDWIRTGAGRVIYAVVLWIVIFSTLEQFTSVNVDLLKLSATTFHLLAFAVAAVAAVFEAVTLRGRDQIPSRRLSIAPPLFGRHSGVISRLCEHSP
jgi:hypothetical protein